MRKCAQYEATYLSQFLLSSTTASEAGIRLLQLPRLSFIEKEILLPGIDLANVILSFVHPIFKCRTEDLKQQRGIRNKISARIYLPNKSFLGMWIFQT